MREIDKHFPGGDIPGPSDSQRVRGPAWQEVYCVAQLGQVAAVEQLQELDREFDVADAAMAGLDVLGRKNEVSWVARPESAKGVA